MVSWCHVVGTRRREDLTRFYVTRLQNMEYGIWGKHDLHYELRTMCCLPCGVAL